MKIAILEDNPPQLAMLVSWLQEAGHEVTGFSNGREYMKSLQSETYDLLLLDWEIPDYAGIDVLAWLRLRQYRNTPAIMLTHKTSEEDVVTALKIGADDVIRKPAQRNEVLARIAAVTRRSLTTERRMLEIGKFRLDRVTSRAWHDELEVHLTATQFALAVQFFENFGQVISRERLYAAIWGRSHAIESRTLDAHISNLRAKLGLRAENGLRISMLYNHGYRLESTFLNV
ncbi:response regulator transcription factor [Ralstonia sp. UBA689]|uniref:response regulator transcription factor n=1 Tax=Ralstonia sp. UBA689 TaxID=1947373 RepID=UPI0025D184CE|nr:response regulator transcription factor [Ralstonia sp. UBA689]